MNKSLEFHDSTVSMVRAVGADLIVSFSEVYVHHSLGEPGVSPGEGFVQPAELVFSVALWTGVLGNAVGSISRGRISVDGQPLSLLPLPFTTASAVTAQLVFVSGAVLEVSAASAMCRATGTALFVERFPD